MYGRRRNATPVDRGAGSGTRRTKSGSSHSTQLSGRSSSPPQITRCLPSQSTKGPRRSPLWTTVYTAVLGETEAPPHILTVCLSDNSRDEYQNSPRSDQTESETEPDAESNDIADDDTLSGTGRRTRTAERQQANSQVSTVRVSTTSGWHAVAPVWRTPAGPRHIIQGSM